MPLSYTLMVGEKPRVTTAQIEKEEHRVAYAASAIMLALRDELYPNPQATGLFARFSRERRRIARSKLESARAYYEDPAGDRTVGAWLWQSTGDGPICLLMQEVVEKEEGEYIPVLGTVEAVVEFDTDITEWPGVKYRTTMGRTALEPEERLRHAQDLQDTIDLIGQAQATR